MRQLVLDVIRTKPQDFIQHGARHRAKAVTYNGFAIKPQIAKGSIDRVLAHGAVGATYARKHVSATLRQWPELLQHGSSLCGQGHDMRRLSLAGYVAPLAGIQVDICPLGLSQFARPHEKHRSEPEGCAGHR